MPSLLSVKEKQIKKLEEQLASSQLSFKGCRPGTENYYFFRSRIECLKVDIDLLKNESLTEERK